MDGMENDIDERKARVNTQNFLAILKGNARITPLII